MPVKTTKQLLFFLFLMAAPHDTLAQANPPVSSNVDSKVVFDERLIQAQGGKSGSIYLFPRTPTQFLPLVSTTKSFRHRIIVALFPED